jgi:hypothetical protein
MNGETLGDMVASAMMSSTRSGGRFAGQTLPAGTPSAQAVVIVVELMVTV